MRELACPVSRGHRTQLNAKTMPFDLKRLAYRGIKTIFDLRTIRPTICASIPRTGSGRGT